MTITGKVIKKEKKNVKVNLFIEDFLGSIFCFQVRPKNIIKLVEVDTGCIVQVDCSNECKNGINNLILEDIVIV